MLFTRVSSLRAGVVAAAAVLTAVSACGVPHPPGSSSSGPITPEKPAQPITLTLMDGAGDLNFNKVIYDNFAKAHPELVKTINYVAAPSTDVAGKLKAEQRANRVDTSMVLGGAAVLAAGVQQNTWMKILPNYAGSLPDLASLQDENQAKIQAVAQGYGPMNVYSPNGPFLEYNATAVTDVPKTPQALLAWADAHKGKFTYAQPDNSGPAWTWLMALPYLLGDSNPQDPVNGWSKTWAYLKALGKDISSYPPSTSVMNKQIGDGTILMTPSIMSFDVLQHLNQAWSDNIKVAAFDNPVFVGDGHYMMVPQGVSPQTLYVDLELMKFTLQPDQQELVYAQGNMSPAIKGVTPDKAPADGRQVAQKFGRPDFYPEIFAKYPVQAQLPPDVLNKAFDIWNRQIGNQS